MRIKRRDLGHHASNRLPSVDEEAPTNLLTTLYIFWGRYSPFTAEELGRSQREKERAKVYKVWRGRRERQALCTNTQLSSHLKQAMPVYLVCTIWCTSILGKS